MRFPTALPQWRHGDQRRQEGQIREQRDEHARAGNQAQFRQTNVIRRQEGEKRDSCAERTKCQRTADHPGGLGQSRVLVIATPDFLAIAQGKMNAEIDAQADKQDRESNGY